MVEITTKCHLNCKFCSGQGEKPKKDEVGLKEIRKIAEYAKKTPLEKLEITGGEPLIKEELTLFTLKEVGKYSNISSLYSSGTIKNGNSYSEIPKALINRLVKMGLNEFVFNLQGDNSRTHDRLTQSNGSFNRVINSIRNSNDFNIKTGVHFIPNRYNKHQLISVMKLLNDINVNYVKLMRFIPTGRGRNVKDFSLSFKDFKDIIINAQSLHTEFEDIEIRIGFPAKFWLHEDDSKCTAAEDHFLISSDGFIFPCVGFRGFDRELKEKIIPKNTIFETNLEDLIQIMQKKFFNNKTTSLPFECSQCESLESCNGGCIAQRIMNSTKIPKPDPLCPFHLD